MERTTEHKGTKYGILTRRDRAAIARSLADARRQQLESNLKASGAPGDKVFDRMDEFDENRFIIGEQLFNQYIVTDEGIDDVLLRGLRKLNPTATAEDLDKLDLSDEDALMLALKLTGRHIRGKGNAESTAETKVEEKPDPTSPASSGVPAPMTSAA